MQGVPNLTIFARIFLYARIASVTNAVPRAQLRSFVDDIAQTHRGNFGTAHDAKKVATLLTQHFKESRCKISKKSVILGNNKAFVESVIKHARRLGTCIKHVKTAKDLGVGTTAGIRRTTIATSKRYCNTAKRVKRIKILRRIDHRAGRLFNSGASPQATYGKEAFGTPPGLLQKTRAMAAQAVSTGTAGQCPTTLIWLGLGPEHDPAYKTVADQIRMWLWIVDNDDRPIATARSWWAKKTKLHRPKTNGCM